MLKEKPKRMTYAQAKLIDMIESRELKKWCVNNGLTHSGIYRIATGESVPTYRIVCTLCHLIAPIEWIYYTDEKLPFESKCVPQFNFENHSKYIKTHKYDYLDLDLDISKLTAYNIFTVYRSRPTLSLIRTVCDKYNVDPVEFFIDGEELAPPEETYPTSGNIVNVKENICLVISKKEKNKKYSTFTYCPVSSNCQDGIQLKNKTKGFVNIHKIMTADIKLSIPAVIETIDKETLEEVLKAVKEYLE